MDRAVTLAMPPTYDKSIPFLIRKMLNFEYAAKIELVVTSRAIAVETLTIIGATREGIFNLTHVTVNTSLATIQRFDIPDIPIWISVIDKNGVTVPQSVYIHVALAINANTVHALLAGYVYRNNSLTWPMADIKPSDPTPGRITAVSGANPAAGVHATISVPDGQNWRVLAVDITLVTDATISERNFQLIFEVGGSPAFRSVPTINQNASETKQYTFQVGTPGTRFVETNNIIAGIPPNIIIPAGDIITTGGPAMIAGDNFGAMTVTIERWLEFISL